MAAVEVPRLLYIVVVDDDGRKPPSSFRYTRSVLQSTLQLMGCKARHAFKMSRRVFDAMMRSKSSPPLRARRTVSEPLGSLYSSSSSSSRDDCDKDDGCLGGEEEAEKEEVIKAADNSVPFELYQRLTTTVVTRETFLNVVCDALSGYKYVGPNQRDDLILACRIRERKESVTVLLCGTSGCGKSTLSALLGSRLGITTVISTDSIRHMMRSFVTEKQNPLLWASTYHAGECLDPVAVAEAKVNRKAKKLAGASHSKINEEFSDSVATEKYDGQTPDGDLGSQLIGKKQMAIEGFKAQSEMVIDSLDRLITAWEDRKESVVVEGVHLSLNFVMGLMKKHPSIIPFMIYIANEDKHMERFAVRAKYMTLDPSKNKYVKYIRNIRTIQEYLCNRADKHLVPKINNTNVDRSVAAIHATVFSCLRRREAGEQLFDNTTNTVSVIHEEYRNQCAANSLSSKGMYQLIQRKGSSRHLMALLNTDGSVAKAWPVESAGGDGKAKPGNGSKGSIGSPMYGPLQIGKAEPVNLQFGNFGISAWPNDTGGTSNAGSIEDYRADGTETGSRYFSSCCSSPRMSDVPAKEPKEEFSVSGSEEEADDPPAVDTDEDLSDADKELHEEMEGSVDEETKSDDEYEDLAMRDDQENSYTSDDDDDEPSNRKKPTGQKIPGETNSQKTTRDDQREKYQQNFDLFMRISECVPDQPCSYSVISENHRSAEDRKKRSLSDSSRLGNLSESIPASGNSGTIYTGPILSGALKS